MVGTDLKRRWICIILCLLVLLSVTACSKKSTVPVILSNIDFSEIRSDGCPEEWNINSYAGNYSVGATDGILTITANTTDDIRVYQMVGVSENTKYVLSCYVRSMNVSGGHGACLSVDNYAIDGSYISSTTTLSGDTDWTKVELPFETADGQETVCVALRLGYYGGESSGTAQYRDVTFKASSAGGYSYQKLYTQSTSQGSQNESETRETKTALLNSVFAIILISAIIVLIIMIMAVYSKRRAIEQTSLVTKKNFIPIFLGLVLAGLIIRVVLCAGFRGHDTDIGCWIGWGNRMASGGMSNFYSEWCDYPPAYMILLGFISKIASLFKLSSSSTAGLFIYMIPAFAADVGIAWLCVKICRKLNRTEGFTLLVAGLVILNPAATFLSGAWGQIDSILTLLLLWCFVSLFDNKRLFAGVLYGIAIMLKWQALMFGPALAAVYLLSIKNWKDALKTLAAVGLALLTMLLISLPCRQSDQTAFYVVDKFLESSSGYQYASIEAYNFMTLFGGNWAQVSGKAFGIMPFSYQQLGVMMIALAIAATLGMYAYVHKKQVKLGASLLEKRGQIMVIAAFSMFAIFTFGHYMHERYVLPIVFFILIAYVYLQDRRLLLSAILVSFSAFANEMFAMFVVSKDAIDLVRGGMIHNDMIYQCSLIEVCVFVYYAKVTYNLIFGKEVDVKY
ncbi:MAG: glycosyltransferase 87 family protein [Eubacteriales bacterium]|nr:glycosyltransferase 87 family protein [Eubacteriales bacterium]